jgi:hypothetical protein
MQQAWGVAGLFGFEHSLISQRAAGLAEEFVDRL